MLSRTDSGKISGGCKHHRDLAAQRFEVVVAHIDAVDLDTRRSLGSKKRGSSPSIVDLPAPVGPTIATFMPGRDVQVDVVAAPASRRDSGS